MIGLSTLGSIQSLLSDITCGHACWEAKENICHCSCGGKNHGIHNRGGKAERTSKIDGYMYRLQAVGTHRELTKDSYNINTNYVFRWFWDYSYRKLKASSKDDKTPGAIARLKYASKAQIEKWPELVNYQGQDRYFSDAALLWVRTDYDELKASEPQITDEEKRIGEIMKEFSLGESAFVWQTTRANYPNVRFWEKKHCYLFLKETIEKYKDEIPKHKANSCVISW